MVQEHGKPRKCTGKPTRACIRSAQRKPICSSSSKLRGSLVRSTKCLLIEAPLYSNAIRKIFLVTNSDYSVRGPNQIGPSSIRYLKFQNVRTSLFSTRGAFRNWDCYRSPTSAICVLIPTALKSFLCLPLAHWCSNPKTGVALCSTVCTTECLAMALPQKCW